MGSLQLHDEISLRRASESTYEDEHSLGLLLSLPGLLLQGGVVHTLLWKSIRLEQMLSHRAVPVALYDNVPPHKL